MNLVPLADRVVLKQCEAEEKTKSGIILTSAAQEKPQDLSYGAFFSKYRKVLIVVLAMICMYFCHMLINTYMAKIWVFHVLFRMIYPQKL